MMNLFGSLNYLEVIVAGVAYFMLGWIWYSPVLFAKPWMKEMGLNHEKMSAAEKRAMQKDMLPTMLISLVSSFILAMTIAFLQSAFASNGLIGHLFNGAMIWLAFTGGPTLATALYSNEKKIKLWTINAGYPLAGILLLNILMFYWA